MPCLDRGHVLDFIFSIILSEIEKSNHENVKFVFFEQVW